MRSNSLNFFRELANTPSPSGYEERAAEVFRQYTSSFADKINTDIHGNVWSIINPHAKTKIMLAGHIDEIGFIVHYIEENGFLYFQPLGGHDSQIPIGQRVWIHGKSRIPGVIGRKPIHLLEDQERKEKPELGSLWIDIGARSKDEASEQVNIGDVVTYQAEFQELQGGRATARGFDNKVGAFVTAEVLRIIKEDGGLDPNVGLYAVATVQEEIGQRGAQTASYGIGAQTGLAIDVCHAVDYPNISRTRFGSLELGAGPCIMRGANTNPVVFRMIVEAALSNGIPYQVGVVPGGSGTDGNAMQLSSSGMAVGIVGVALRYMHTPCELLQTSDVEACVSLVAAYCRSISPKTDYTPRVM